MAACVNHFVRISSTRSIVVDAVILTNPSQVVQYSIIPPVCRSRSKLVAVLCTKVAFFEASDSQGVSCI